MGEARAGHAEKVLATLRRAGRPLTAYQLLAALRDDGVTAPPTVYRALAQLTAAGGVHRIESLGAYVACGMDAHASAHAFLICDACGTVDERCDPAVQARLAALADRAGFAAGRIAVELRGLCRACRPEAGATA
jgi:Fur family zinc uptake transcriptional regulator